ncbi:MAG: hypothetical protein LBS99_06500, partial [Clostridiales bacterium]|nr:hypothetical protein [Clostridiales bacterium]
TDGTSNYYLLDAGYIKGVFISKLAETTYEGLPFSYTEESTVTSQITDSLTEAVSSTHTTSDTFGNKTSVAAEWEFEAGGAVC